MVQCPSDLDLYPSGALSAQAYWNQPRPAYNGYSVALSSSVPSGTSFSVGTTLVTYTAVVNANNKRLTSSCSFSVTVHGLFIAYVKKQNLFVNLLDMFGG